LSSYVHNVNTSSSLEAKQWNTYFTSVDDLKMNIMACESVIILNLDFHKMAIKWTNGGTQHNSNKNKF